MTGQTSSLRMLSGKRILVTGLASNRSIAWGVARAMHREGAELAFTFQNERLGERVNKLAAELGSSMTIGCDVSRDAEIDHLFELLGDRWGGLDGLVHAIAFAPREALEGDFFSGLDREAFRTAHDVSAYSFVALARGGRELMRADGGGALLTLTYLGSQRVFPGYNVMGPAKASLEATVRYLAHDLGPEGIRVNAISAGPIRTLAASGISGFRKLLDHAKHAAPLRRNVTIDDVGNAAAFLCSDLAGGITGEITCVDAGYHVLGTAPP